MVVCKRSPGIPSDDRRFVDIWGDDSLTISESSLTSENVVTVVEVHAAAEDEKQDEKTEKEAPDDEFEEENVALYGEEGKVICCKIIIFRAQRNNFILFPAFEESAANLEVQEKTEAQEDTEDDESNEIIEDFAAHEVKEEEQIEAENIVHVDEKEILNETCKL
jgi:hypothetical protein